MTSPVSAIEAIEKAMEGVTNKITWSVEGYDEDTGQMNVVGNGFFIAGAIANQPDQEATAAFIAACNPVAMREVLALARQAEALQRENAELRSIMGDFIQAHIDGPGLLDCMDNAGNRYTSQFLADAISCASALFGGSENAE